jgi:hypothetical protein
VALTSRPVHLGLFAPVFTALAFSLTVLGTFLPFFLTEQSVGLEPSGIARTTSRAWRIDYTFPGQGELSSPAAPIGLPLLLASALLLVAGILGIRQSVTGRPSAAVRRTTLAGATFLAGVVCTIGMDGAPRLFSDRTPEVETTALAGMWVLTAAVLAAAAAAVLSDRRFAAGRPEWADPEAAFADTTTPPSGVVITVLPPEDD